MLRTGACLVSNSSLPYSLLYGVLFERSQQQQPLLFVPHGTSLRGLCLAEYISSSSEPRMGGCSSPSSGEKPPSIKDLAVGIPITLPAESMQQGRSPILRLLLRTLYCCCIAPSAQVEKYRVNLLFGKNTCLLLVYLTAQHYHPPRAFPKKKKRKKKINPRCCLTGLSAEPTEHSMSL